MAAAPSPRKKNMGSSQSSPQPPANDPVSQITNRVERLDLGYSGNINQVLDKVLSKLKLQEDKIKETNAFLDGLVKQKLITGLKSQSALFALIFKEITWVGSFYEGLKISHPDEFDLNVVLRMPGNEKDITLEARSDLPGYVTVKNYGKAIQSLQDDPKWKPVYHEIKKWNDTNTGHLQQTMVRRWMEGIMQKFVDDYNKNLPPNQQQLRFVKSGPAMTLWIGKQMSIDVVPVFSFKTPPPKPIREPRPLNRDWFIVPKPVDNENLASDAWRTSFYQFEKDIIRDYGKIKPAIKLIKKLRDNQNWSHSLYSYAIKTAALWMKENGELSENDKIEIAFIKLLRGILRYLEQGNLPFYWEQRCNMLKMTLIERENYIGRLKRLIRKFEDNWQSNPSFIAETIVPIDQQPVPEESGQQAEANGCTIG